MGIENGKGPGNQEVKQVKVVSKTKVYPSKREVKGECPLVTFDLLYVTFYYNQKVLLYKGGDFDESVKKLKEGLGLALVHFYPLSGSLGRDEEGVLLVEKCGADDTGAFEVIEAVAIDVGVVELAGDKLVSNILRDIVPFAGVLNLEGFHRPLLPVQVGLLATVIAITNIFRI